MPTSGDEKLLGRYTNRHESVILQECAQILRRTCPVVHGNGLYGKVIGKNPECFDDMVKNCGTPVYWQPEAAQKRCVCLRFVADVTQLSPAISSSSLDNPE